MSAVKPRAPRRKPTICSGTSSKLLARLEHDEKRQPSAGAETLVQGQDRFFLVPAITSVQFLVAQRMGKSGIGSAVDRSHVEPTFLSSGVRKTPAKKVDRGLDFSGAYKRASEGTKTNCFWYTLERVSKHVAIYARVSTGEQTPDNQLQELRAVAKRMGWHVAAEYIDHGISGAKGRDRRPDYDQL